MSTSKPTVTIYTDGGADPNPGTGGWGAVLLFPGREQELSGGERDSTNNRMELTAAITALESLPEPHEVDLYTDSEYLKNGITQWIKGWIKKDWRGVKNPDLWQRLHQATQHHTIHWHWVKGHAGNQYNERVDRLAAAEIGKLTGRPVAAAKPKQDTVDTSAVKVYLGIAHSRPGNIGAWSVVIVKPDGEQEISGDVGDVTENQLAILAAIKAFEQLKSPTSISVYTDKEYLQKGMSQWIRGWLRKGWRNSEGEPVKNRELWERLLEVTARHQTMWMFQDKSASEQSRRAFDIARAKLPQSG